MTLVTEFHTTNAWIVSESRGVANERKLGNSILPERFVSHSQVVERLLVPDLSSTTGVSIQEHEERKTEE
jgi:hypothetical protein